MPFFLGIDIGGTKILAVLANEKGKIKRRVKIPTQAVGGKKRVLENVFKALWLAKGTTKIKAIGLAPAGVIDAKQTMLVNAPNLRCLEGADLKKAVAKQFHTPILVENDANTAAVAEARIGAGKGAKNLVFLTLGTGVGSGIILDKKLVVGSNHAGAELGHTVVKAGGPKCRCGNNGCLEALAGSYGIEKRAREMAKGKKTILKHFDPRSVEEAAQKGDALARRVMEETGFFFGIGLANIANALNPEIIVIGGGIANSKMLLAPAIKTLKRFAFKEATRKLKVMKAKLGEEAGAIGAALFAFENAR